MQASQDVTAACGMVHRAPHASSLCVTQFRGTGQVNLQKTFGPISSGTEGGSLVPIFTSNFPPRAMALTPAQIGWPLIIFCALLLVFLSWRSHRRSEEQWQEAHRRLVSMDHVEEGALSPELARVAAAVRLLDEKLLALQGEGPPDAGVAADTQQPLSAGSRGLVGAPISPNAATVGDGDESPFVRPRKPTAVVSRSGTPGTGVAHRIVGHGIEDTIFVSIASYRDEQCAPTILDMYRRAKRPEAIFVGIVEQHFPQDPSCIPKEYDSCQSSADFCPTDHMQVRRITPNKARGPTFGRFYGMLMYRGESYLFMMDSHNRFVTHWDHIIVRMYKGLPTAKGVLSHYPEAWHNPEDNEQTNAPLDQRKTTTYLCTAKFIQEGFPRLDGFVVHKTTKPRPQPWAAAGFLFADARIIFEVPFDPHLNYIFDGEEILYSVRLWTSGWDIFSPNENIMYHYYYRKKAKKFWSLLPHDWVTHRDRAMRRIQYLLNVTKDGTTERVVPADTKEEYVLVDLDRYGLGKERSLREYYEWAGIDPVKRKIENRWCPRA